MPIDFDASRDAAVAPGAQLQRIFDAPLRRAAQQLIDLGAVSDVRVLQSGRVVTGIAGDRQRVYIQYRRAGAPTIEGECSCGEPTPCVHVAAVAMAAAEISGARVSRRTGMDLSTSRDPLPQSPESALAARCSSAAVAVLPHRARRRPRIAAFRVGNPDLGGQRATSNLEPALSLCEFPTEVRTIPVTSKRRTGRILDVLMARQFDWNLTGTAGFDLLQRALATGRAFWRSLQASALREGGAREVLFTWQVLPNGDQRLICETPERLDFLLELEPAVYIDTVSGNCGLLELPYPVDLLRQYWNRTGYRPGRDLRPQRESRVRTPCERLPATARDDGTGQTSIQSATPADPLRWPNGDLALHLQRHGRRERLAAHRRRCGTPARWRRRLSNHSRLRIGAATARATRSISYQYRTTRRGVACVHDERSTGAAGFGMGDYRRSGIPVSGRRRE